ncbi:putative ferric-chelate reductase 1 [Xiphias gladius]|uniref:putative ferric-chelate reductase 1 n=1 Tax=Xiphias gladius TaxID=8245 RepID=UPI001A98007F|nr:putative ferric-chelate reductase 1 [Xiphias gladius]
MDNRLVFTVLFVTLSWMSLRTCAKNDTTAAPANNMTTVAPPLTLNTTVETLKTPVSRTGCGTQQLCAAEPSECDPSMAGSCFFLAVKRQSGQNFEFGLSGESDGYLAATLSPGATVGDNDTTYVCAKNNGGVQFFSTLLSNGHLIETVLNVNSVRGSVTGSRIQCTFSATVPSPETRTSGFSLSISTGPFNSTSGTLGAPNTALRSPVVDLGNPNTTITNALSPNTTTSLTANVTQSPANNMTAQPTSQVLTAAPPLTPNTTVEALETPVSRTGCGTQQLCAAEPSECDPSMAGSCFFLAVKRQSGQNFEFGLSGESDGYLAATLSPGATVGDNDTTYVCANNNGVVQFFSTLLSNGDLIETVLNVNSVRGSVTGSRIQCTFAATVPSPETRTSGFSLSISTGPFNSTSNTLGASSIQFRSAVVDLGNPDTILTNELSQTNSTTSSPNTTSYAITFQQSLMQALLISVGALGLAML